MNKSETVKRVYNKGELQKKLEEKFDFLKKEVIVKDYRTIGIFFCEIANLLVLLGREEEAKKYYEMSIEMERKVPENYRHTHSIIDSLISLERYDEVLQIMLTEGNWHKYAIATIYEKKGDLEKARNLYGTIAQEYEKKAIGEEWHFIPQYYQDASDLWEKAGNIEKAKELNKKAIQSWLQLRNKLEKNEPPIHLAWLYEEIGYIYEKAENFEEAFKYYDAAEEKYKLAYSEEHEISTSAFKADQDWSYRVDEHFFIQMPEMSKWGFYMNYSSGEPDFKRIKYRKLLLEKEMKESQKDKP